MTPPPFLPHYIHGQRVAKSDGETFISSNPATGEPLFEVEHATKETLETAINSAKEGQKFWAKATAADRGRVLNRAAALLREHNDRLANLEVQDCGKPISEASAVDVASAADCLEYFGGVAASIHGAHYDLDPVPLPTRRDSGSVWYWGLNTPFRSPLGRRPPRSPRVTLFQAIGAHTSHRS